MIKDALQYLVKLGNVETKNIGETVYSTEKLFLVPEQTPSVLEVRSLSGLVEYLISEFDHDELSEKKMVHIVSPTEVIAFSSFNRDYKRNSYIQANAMLPAFNFDRWYDAENFNIKLQSAFVKNEDRDIMLKVVGNIKEESVRQIGDDGISQAVQAKTGIATVSTVKVPNPVLLAPFRTFVEVNQPESEFVFRMQSGPQCALFEADGGAWKLQAMKNIKEYLKATLVTEIEAGKIVIIA
jgi:hypothetical protein